MKKIFLAGHNGMVGSAIHKLLKYKKNIKIITRSHSELDLCDQKAVKNFMEIESPDEVIIAAAKVGGIHANNMYPADFIYQNLQMQSNLIHYSHIQNVQKLLFLGSSCIYPKYAKQPMKEDVLLTGSLEQQMNLMLLQRLQVSSYVKVITVSMEETTAQLCPQIYMVQVIIIIQENSHVVPGLIRRFHEAKVNNQETVVVWGTGNPRREFLYVDDMAEACLFIHN